MVRASFPIRGQHERSDIIHQSKKIMILDQRNVTPDPRCDSTVSFTSAHSASNSEPSSRPSVTELSRLLLNDPTPPPRTPTSPS